MPKLKETAFGQEPILVEGLYPGAKLVETNGYVKNYEGKDTNMIAWIFEVPADADKLDEDVDPDEEFTGTLQIAAHTSEATGDRSNFVKFGFPAFVGEDWDYDSDSCLGYEADVYVESYQKKDGSYRNVISKLKVDKKTANKNKKHSEKAETPVAGDDAPSLDESDFEDIPF